MQNKNDLFMKLKEDYNFMVKSLTEQLEQARRDKPDMSKEVEHLKERRAELRKTLEEIRSKISNTLDEDTLLE